MTELADLTRTAGADVRRLRHSAPSRGRPCALHRHGQGRRAARAEDGRRFRPDYLQRRSQPAPAAQPRAGIEDARARPTEVILEIFAQHARTHEGRLQVEAARLHHCCRDSLAPTRTTASCGRSGGVGGSRWFRRAADRVERRRIRKRMRDLEGEIEQVRLAAASAEDGRRRPSWRPRDRGLHERGKSTLLNSLTGARVQAEPAIVRATLDPTTRRLDLPTGRRALLTTPSVFIQKLPTDLVAAFRATLEEVTEADLISRWSMSARRRRRSRRRQ